MAVYLCAPFHKRFRCTPEEGFTLIEVLVATLISTVAMLALFAMLEAVTKSSANDQERGSSLIEETAALHDMVQEIGETYKFNGPTTNLTKANYVDVDAWVTPGSSQKGKRLVFDCEVSSTVSGERECVRYEMPLTKATTVTELKSDWEAKPKTLPTEVTGKILIPRLINGTESAPAFELETPRTGTTPTYGRVNIETPASGERVSGSYSGANSYQYTTTLRDSFAMRNLTLGE